MEDGPGTRTGPAARAARPRIQGQDRMKIFFSDDYVASATAFDTLRKSAWVAGSLHAHPIDGVSVVAPDALTASQVATVHASRYVEAVRTGQPRELAESNGFSWDAGLWSAVCASNGGVVAAALEALKTGLNAGSLSSGLHHAKRDHGEGFCTLNGLVLAARAALEAGATRVLVLDLDAHMGGGTYSLIRGLRGIEQIDIAVCPYTDAYRPASGSHCLLDVVAQANEYLPQIGSRLTAVHGRPDLVLYNAGVDPHERSGIGALRGVKTQVLAEREAVVFDWARRIGTPVAFVLAGGYVSSGRYGLTEDTLVELHRLTLAAAV
jgi:acetoin utilization deacetylase AcuC-like enzyme